ncbi:HNH endonuclease signature motif containing protein [Thermoactinomyces sp. DSM 45891]|uniref:HNH endonuclease n=1 Tax=Thermoactinomyces sp. DSM 45891 TaxID=1761907 RepID=UPI0009F5F46F
MAEYIGKYGDPKKKDDSFNWADYDIHHIIPREYGGTNDFDNLIPLPRDFHQQRVTPWWNSGYR